jgi:rhodanese-related sulfurtransferase
MFSKLIAGLLGVLMLGVGAVSAADELRITKEDTRELMAGTELVVIDVRQPSDWTGSKKKIQGAVREEPQDINAWMTKYPKEKILILYCS